MGVWLLVVGVGVGYAEGWDSGWVEWVGGQGPAVHNQAKWVN